MFVFFLFDQYVLMLILTLKFRLYFTNFLFSGLPYVKTALNTDARRSLASCADDKKAFVEKPVYTSNILYK